MGRGKIKLITSIPEPKDKLVKCFPIHGRKKKKERKKEKERNSEVQSNLYSFVFNFSSKWKF